MIGPTDNVEIPLGRFENFGSVTNTRYASVEEYEHLHMTFPDLFSALPSPSQKEKTKSPQIMTEKLLV